MIKNLLVWWYSDANLASVLITNGFYCSFMICLIVATIFFIYLSWTEDMSNDPGERIGVMLFLGVMVLAGTFIIGFLSPFFLGLIGIYYISVGISKWGNYHRNQSKSKQTLNDK